MKTPKRHINRSYNYNKLNDNTFVSQSHDIIFNPLSDDQIKISELPESSGLDSNDIIPVVEISGTQLITKKISLSNFTNSITGSGNYLTRFNSSGSGITNSVIYQTGNKIGLGTTTPTYDLHIIGSGNFSQNAYVNNIPVSISGHVHTISDITNFGSGVSGLLTPYATLNSPNFTGIPTAPTASSGTNTNQIANTSFVRTEISNLVNSAPITLDTLNELATALGNDPNFATTVTNLIGNKVSKTGDTMTGTLNCPSGLFSSGLLLNNVSVSISGHKHISSDITDFNNSVTGLFPSAFNTSLINGSGINLTYNSLSETLTISTTGVSISGHTHSSVDITDFNSSVSGLLPTISNSGDNRILTSTGSSIGINAESLITASGAVIQVGTTGLSLAGASLPSIQLYSAVNESAKIIFKDSTGTDRFIIMRDDEDDDNKIISGSPLVITAGNGSQPVNIASSGLLYNGTQVSVSGHTHTSSQITDFNEAVDDRIGSGLFVAGTGINLNYNDAGNSFTVSITGLVNNPTNDRILTSRDNTTTGIDAESNATFDGTNFNISGVLNIDNLRLDGNTISSTNANSNIIITPSGSGALQRDGGGNTRGSYAIDWQTERFNNNQVASGPYSVIGGGTYNRAAGQENVIAGGNGNYTDGLVSVIAGGTTNKALRDYSAVVGGAGNTVSGDWSFIGGGNLNTVNDNFSSILGGYNNICSGSYGAILGGSDNNDGNYNNVFILGSNITGTQNNTTYVQNLNIANDVRISGNFVATSGNFTNLTINSTGISISGHTHTASNITDFNSSISGLLPVKSIVGSGNISVTSVSGNFTIGSSGLVKSDITGITGASGISNMIQISQANYDALVTKDSSTLYVIT